MAAPTVPTISRSGSFRPNYSQPTEAYLAAYDNLHMNASAYQAVINNEERLAAENFIADDIIQIPSTSSMALGEYDQNSQAFARMGNVQEIDNAFSKYQLKQTETVRASFDLLNKNSIRGSNLMAFWDVQMRESIIPSHDLQCSDSLTSWTSMNSLRGANFNASTSGALYTSINTEIAALYNSEQFDARQNAAIIINANLMNTFWNDPNIINSQNYRAQEVIWAGNRPMLFGCPVYFINSDRISDGKFGYMITGYKSINQPQKVKFMRVFDKVPGLAGELLEYFGKYDTFVLKNQGRALRYVQTG